MMRWKNMACALTCVTLIFGTCLQIAMGEKEVNENYQIVEQITRDIDTPQKRSGAIAKLSAIVKDSTQSMRLRRYAAKKLGEIGAIETKDMLKTVAENLEWSDSTRILKWHAFEAYWKIRVAEEPSKKTQVELLMEALHERFDGLRADNVRRWAVNELANRGIEEAFPEIVKSIKSTYSGDRAEEQIQLCTTKIKLVSSSTSRQEALSTALATEDPTRRQFLKQWAIDQLGKLKTEESRMMLINYALGLQKEYYDETGKRIVRKGDWLSRRAPMLYGTIIRILEDSGMSDSEIKATGLRPDELFVILI